MSARGHHGLLLSEEIVGSDPYWANVVSLLHFDGASGGTTFTDQASMTWTASSGATTQAAAAKFGSAGGRFTPNGACITSGSAISGGMPGDFTIEAWVFPTAAGTCALCRWATSNRSIYINSAQVAWYNGASMASLSGVMSLSTWHHVAVVRQSGTIRAYVDGVSSGATLVDATNLSTTFTVGGDTFNQELAGDMDEFRITKGVARYTSSFVPPTAPFPNS